MTVVWRRAAAEDAAMLTQLRLTVLRAANDLADDAPLPDVERATCDYYRRAMADGSCVTYLGEEDGHVVCCGAVCFYTVMPTCDDPKGQKAYIMNMYTSPTHRRRGLARHTLALLVKEARARGVDAIALEATEHGRPLYAQFGFVASEHEMHLP